MNLNLHISNYINDVGRKDGNIAGNEHALYPKPL